MSEREREREREREMRERENGLMRSGHHVSGLEFLSPNCPSTCVGCAESLSTWC